MQAWRDMGQNCPGVVLYVTFRAQRCICVLAGGAVVAPAALPGWQTPDMGDTELVRQQKW